MIPPPPQAPDLFRMQGAAAGLFCALRPQQAVQKGEGWVLAAKAVVTALAENTLGELESYEKTLEVAVPLPITPPEGTVLVPECWLSTENVQCTVRAAHWKLRLQSGQRAQF